MDFENFTPFPSLCFDFIGPSGAEYHVTVTRATFKIAHLKPLVLSDTQLVIAMLDSYHGTPGASSLQFPSDLVPFKPRSDIILNATAFAPGGKSSMGWPVSVKVGDHYKSLCITGPRYWKKK